MARDKVVLAYSGGLDTSVAVKWINETYGMDVIAYTCDLGQGQDIEAIRQKALRTGAIEAIAEDARNLFVDYFVFPSLAAGALYEGKYPLATALGRPLDRAAHGPGREGAWRGGGRTRLHRQGERSGPIRRHLPDARAGAEDHRPGPRVEVDAHPGARVRRDSTASRSRRPRNRSSAPTRTSGAARSRRASWKTPGSSRRPRRSSGPPTPGWLPTSPRKSRSPSTAASPRPSTAARSTASS